MNGSSPIADFAADRTAIAVLAGGKASRFGGVKLDADLGGKPLGKWICDTADGAAWKHRFIVTSCSAPDFVSALAGWQRVENADADQGIGTSIAAAAKAARGCERLLIALADMPLVSAAHLRAISTRTGLTFTQYPNGRIGVPAAFPERCFAPLERLSGEQGAASIDWQKPIATIAPNASELVDVDTAQALHRLRAELRC